MSSTVVFWIKAGTIFFILTMLAVIDVITKEFKSIKVQVFWGLVALIPFVGWLIYLVFGFRAGKRRKTWN